MNLFFPDLHLLVGCTPFVCQISNGEVFLKAGIFLSLLYKHGGHPFVSCYGYGV